MIQRFHGMDRHKKCSTISVLNREGEEVRFLSACYDLRPAEAQTGRFGGGSASLDHRSQVGRVLLSFSG
jgi:hypothetical protein